MESSPQQVLPCVQCLENAIGLHMQVNSLLILLLTKPSVLCSNLVEVAYVITNYRNRNIFKKQIAFYEDLFASHFGLSSDLDYF